MWLVIISPIEGNRYHDVVWSEGYDRGAYLVDQNIARRCLGPDGKCFEESAPEEVAACIANDNAPEELKKMRQGYLW